MRDEDIEGALLTLFKKLEAAESATLAKMFNSLGLKVGSRFVAFAHRGGLGIRLPPKRVAEIVSQGKARAFMGSRERVLRGWAVVPIEQIASWERLLKEAISIDGRSRAI